MSNRSKEKGDRRERQVVEMYRRCGLRAERVPLSGAAQGSFGGDVAFWDADGQRCLAEVKARQGGGGWKVIEGWLGDNDVLFLVKDRAEPLVVMRQVEYERLLRGWYVNERHRSGPQVAPGGQPPPERP